jgi:hypothetical protein
MALPDIRTLTLTLAVISAVQGCKPSRPAETVSRNGRAGTSLAIPDPQALHALAKEVLPSRHLVPVLSPMLPLRWPEPSGAVQWLVYSERVLPTSISSTQLQGPVARITLRIPDGKPKIERFDRRPPAFIGAEFQTLPPPSLDSAEAALVRIELGHADAGSLKPVLKAYLAWADASPVLGPDVRARHADFFRWLAAP